MGDFIERHVLAQIVVIIAATFAVAFVIAWLPYGFVTADLTINPFTWEEWRRGLVIMLWAPMLMVLGLSACS